jgi:Cysteine rich repeat
MSIRKAFCDILLDRSWDVETPLCYRIGQCTVLAMERKGNMLIRFLSAGLIVSCLIVAPAKTQAQGLEDLRTYCVSDIKRVCKGVKPGGGRLLQCLKAKKKE